MVAREEAEKKKWEEKLARRKERPRVKRKRTEVAKNETQPETPL